MNAESHDDVSRGSAEPPSGASDDVHRGESPEARRERMRELGKRGGKRSGEVRRSKAQKRAEAVLCPECGAEIGSVAGLGERVGVAEPLDPRKRLEYEAMHSPNPASRVAALRALLDVEQAVIPAKPPSIAKLESMSTEELEAIVRAYC